MTRFSSPTVVVTGKALTRWQVPAALANVEPSASWRTWLLYKGSKIWLRGEIAADKAGDLRVGETFGSGMGVPRCGQTPAPCSAQG